MDAVCAHIIVHGLVQGVGFRYFVSTKARALGIRGFVRNRYDGTVEIVAEGTSFSVEQLLLDVRLGPRAAHVTELTVEWEEPRNQQASFEIQ